MHTCNMYTKRVFAASSTFAALRRILRTTTAPLSTSPFHGSTKTAATPPALPGAGSQRLRSRPADHAHATRTPSDRLECLEDSRAWLAATSSSESCTGVAGEQLTARHTRDGSASRSVVQPTPRVSMPHTRAGRNRPAAPRRSNGRTSREAAQTSPASSPTSLDLPGKRLILQAAARPKKPGGTGGFGARRRVQNMVTAAACTRDAAPRWPLHGPHPAPCC